MVLVSGILHAVLNVAHDARCKPREQHDDAYFPNWIDELEDVRWFVATHDLCSPENAKQHNAPAYGFTRIPGARRPTNYECFRVFVLYD